MRSSSLAYNNVWLMSSMDGMSFADGAAASSLNTYAPPRGVQPPAPRLGEARHLRLGHPHELRRRRGGSTSYAFSARRRSSRTVSASMSMRCA